MSPKTDTKSHTLYTESKLKLSSNSQNISLREVQPLRECGFTFEPSFLGIKRQRTAHSTSSGDHSFLKIYFIVDITIVITIIVIIIFIKSLMALRLAQDSLYSQGWP